MNEIMRALARGSSRESNQPNDVLEIARACLG
jgi:hypothetical protein